MTIMTLYHDIPIVCPSCNATHDHVHIHIRWTNRHGACVRVFCNVCGVWTDRKITDKDGLTDRVVPHAIPHPGCVEHANGLD